MALLFRLAPNALRGLLHEKAGFREAFERQPAERPVQGSEGLVPSEEVKRALELAFAESQLVGDGTVGTGHLLVGMLQVETSGAALAMAEFGVTLGGARAKLRELAASGVVPETSTERKPPDRELTEWTEAAQVLARSEGSASVRVDHLLRSAPRSRAATELLGRLGIDLPAALATVPAPPAQLAKVEASLSELASLRRQGARQRLDRPLQLDDAERAARDERDRIHDEWIQAWGPPPHQ